MLPEFYDLNNIFFYVMLFCASVIAICECLCTKACEHDGCFLTYPQHHHLQLVSRMMAVLLILAAIRLIITMPIYPFLTGILAFSICVLLTMLDLMLYLAMLLSYTLTWIKFKKKEQKKER